MIVNVTGVFYLPSGVVASSRMVAFKPIDRSVRAGYLGGLVPDPVIIQTGIDGSVDFNLLTGSYFVTIEAKDTDNIGRGLIFAGKANVPDAPSASISEILDAAVAPDVPPVWYTQAIQAAEDAIDAADRAEAAAAGVEYPVSYAPQTLTAPQQAQARANIGAASLSRTITAGAGLTGGGDLTADRTLAADFATGAEALAGTATDKVMSPARVREVVSWRRVGKVNVGTGAAVTLTGLDLTKETMFIVSFVKNTDTSARELRLRASEDGGATWGPNWIGVSASANWSAGTLRGAVELFPDSANGSVITSSLLSGAAGADARQYAPAEVVIGGVPVFTPASDTVEFYWSAGNFAASGVPAPETDCIIIYQRG